jgi:hypothetical protein
MPVKKDGVLTLMATSLCPSCRYPSSILPVRLESGLDTLTTGLDTEDVKVVLIRHLLSLSAVFVSTYLTCRRQCQQKYLCQEVLACWGRVAASVVS